MIFQNIVNSLISEGPIMFPIIGALHLFFYGLNKKSKGICFLGIILFLIIFFILSPFIMLLPGLASDSYFEAIDFNFPELFFYIKTFSLYVDGEQLLFWVFIGIEYGALFILLVVGIKNRKINISFDALNLFFSLGLIIPLLLLAGFHAVLGYNQGVSYINSTHKNFIHESDVLNIVSNSEEPLDIVIYIGESASRLHWSLYGYPRKTTASLDAIFEKNGILKFDKINSTHSHTSQSLLEALSIGQKPLNLLSSPRPIGMQKRISIIDILNDAGVETSLISNQGRSGTWNMVSSIIFKNADHKVFSTNRDLGNFDDHDDEKPYDHVLLPSLYSSLRNVREKNKRLYFFHSYAGHGDYLKNIPLEYHSPVDDFVSNFSDDAFFGEAKAKNIKNNLEGYDSAMRYVSDNISRTLNEVGGLSQPAIVIYLSDHGESPLSGLGHDSSRYVWEMSAIPFVIFFNESAKLKYPNKYLKYSALAKLNHPDSIANISRLIFDLLDIKYSYIGLNGMESTCLFGSGNCYPDYHMTRELSNGGISYIKLNSSKSNYGDSFLNKTDRVTSYANLFELTDGEKDFNICYHRANTVASIIRAKALSSCLELDVFIEEGAAYVFHPPYENVGLKLSDALAIIKGGSNYVWLDSKNIDNIDNCIVLADLLSENKYGDLAYFVEFPSDSVEKLKELEPCIKKLKNIDAYISYYISTDLGRDCIKYKHCDLLKSQVSAINSSGLFTDISYDYKIMESISHLGVINSIKHSMWHVDDDKVEGLQENKFRFIMPYSKDINFR